MAGSNRRELIKQGIVMGLGGLVISPVSKAAPDRPESAMARGGAFGIHVVDAKTGRGVPLVELRTVNDVRYYTDSAGYAAVADPGFMNRKVYFNISAPGYEHPADGFGYRGFAADIRPRGSIRVSIERVDIAERLYRTTGEGIYLDSVLLGHPSPIEHPLMNGDVMGQDSVLATVYRGKVHWFWGDTGRPSYPLGNFRTSGATSELPGQGGLDPAVGVNLHYYTDAAGFCRPMCPLPGESGGVVWMGGLTVVPDRSGRMKMVALYSRRQGMGRLYEHGLALWNDHKNVFQKHTVFPLEEKWRLPTGQASDYAHGGKNYRIFNPEFPTVRVEAILDAVADVSRYEGFSCLKPGTHFAGRKSRIHRRADGTAIWSWHRDTPPLSSAQEAELIAAGLIKPHEAHFQLTDAATGKSVRIAAGSFYFNHYLKKWVMIGCQVGGESFLGEVWCAAADQPTGPWRKAVKVATHPHYSFYNPTQHPFFDQDHGRYIYFEGTYSVTFSGNTHPVPRYDYNQLMYRLDLADQRLEPIWKL
jgi:hypothetical protein